MKIWTFGQNQKICLDLTISKKHEKSYKINFSAYEKLSAEKHVFLNQNRWRFEILIKTKKIRFDVTISKKQK